MNFRNILHQIEQTDPEVYEKTSQRRDILKNLGKGLTMAAIPFALGSMFKKAYGQGTASIIDTLNFALTLEYLEAEFYTKALESGALNTAGALETGSAQRGAIDTIRKHEDAHVAFLQSAITGAGGTPVSKPTFDFTAGSGSGSGPFLGVFSNYELFLAVAQTFEDTGVRAYKGQAGNLMSNNDVLTAALQIHSVEARHASHIRYMRRKKAQAGTDPLAAGIAKPWITGAQSNIGTSAVDPSYAGENMTNQAGVAITGLAGIGGNISADAASEAFDEILTKDAVLAIVTPFIAA